MMDFGTNICEYWTDGTSRAGELQRLAAKSRTLARSKVSVARNPGEKSGCACLQAVSSKPPSVGSS